MNNKQKSELKKIMSQTPTLSFYYNIIEDIHNWRRMYEFTIPQDEADIVTMFYLEQFLNEVFVTLPIINQNIEETHKDEVLSKKIVDAYIKRFDKTDKKKKKDK